MVEYLEARHWIWAAELLSLDFARPVYEHLGIGIRFEESLRGILRDALLSRLAPQRLADSSESLDETIESYERNIVPALGVLEAAFGENTRAALQYWVQYVYDSDENPWAAYLEFFSTWASRVRREERDSIGLSLDAIELAFELKNATSIRDIEDQIGSIRAAQPLSEWDRRLFERRGLSAIPAGSDYLPFVSEIQLCVGMNRFQMYFRRLATLLNSRDREIIETAVGAQLAAGQPRVRIDELPIPPVCSTL